MHYATLESPRQREDPKTALATALTTFRLTQKNLERAYDAAQTKMKNSGGIPVELGEMVAAANNHADHVIRNRDHLTARKINDLDMNLRELIWQLEHLMPRHQLC